MSLGYSWNWKFLTGEALVSKSHSMLCGVSLSPTLGANNGAVRLATSAAESKASAEIGKRPLRGIMKPRPISPALQEFFGVPEIARTQALKLIWAHIKNHNLQDPENKRIIVCDEKLKKIFGGRERVGFLEISGLISPHFL